ncbi:hypothetical protein POM88_029459 [Heracleum sosnowskyi]|uniref:MADS-box domain-containing protein n=2 Tax=Heracleum sosnowskyi TaxID=360622 RepID=A0AAD8HTY7_9APIA|nr:hypothetical protein POM88_029458 [Heracleum sosnowskyi]KAK1373266.1 hypothetical protein POM88_029459 [Heracleum sosnowskyi]
MGRAKSNMELIKKETLRNRTFQQKNNTLKKKIHELATLCDVKAALIVYGPRKDTLQDHPLEPEIWPQNSDHVRELINQYKGLSPEDRKTRTSLLSHFFNEKIKKAQQALTKQRNDNVKSKYPTWHSRLDSLKEDDLRKNVVSLDNVIGNAKAKLKQMKANNMHRANQMLLLQQQQQQQQLQQQQQQQQQQQVMLSKKRKMDSDAGNQAYKYPKIDQHQANSGPGWVPFPIHQQMRPFIDHNWNQPMVNFGNEYVRGTSNIVHNAPMPEAFCNYPTMAGTPGSISFMNNLGRAPPNYYGEGRQPIPQYVMGYRPMTEGSNFYQMPSNQYYEDRKFTDIDITAKDLNKKISEISKVLEASCAFAGLCLGFRKYQRGILMMLDVHGGGRGRAISFSVGLRGLMWCDVACFAFAAKHDSSAISFLEIEVHPPERFLFLQGSSIFSARNSNQSISQVHPPERSVFFEGSPNFFSTNSDHSKSQPFA